MACSFVRKTLFFVLAALIVPALSAPTLKETSENKVSTDHGDEHHFRTEEEQERVVAGLILQLARDYDEGRLSLVDLVGRSAMDDDAQLPEVPAVIVPQDLSKPAGVKTVSEGKPVRTG